MCLTGKETRKNVICHNLLRALENARIPCKSPLQSYWMISSRDFLYGLISTPGRSWEAEPNVDSIVFYKQDLNNNSHNLNIFNMLIKECILKHILFRTYKKQVVPYSKYYMPIMTCK